MVSAAPKLADKTAKVATDLMASASLVAIVDGRGHSAKREVIKYSDILFSAHNPYCFCILPIQNTLLLFKSMVLVETMSIQVFNVHV